MADDSNGDRTERATGKRREEARKKGNVAKSGEISSVSVLLAGFSILYVLSVFMIRELSLAMVGTIEDAFEQARKLQAE